jgi:hypothetical protein
MCFFSTFGSIEKKNMKNKKNFVRTNKKNSIVINYEFLYSDILSCTLKEKINFEIF